MLNGARYKVTPNGFNFSDQSKKSFTAVPAKQTFNEQREEQNILMPVTLNVFIELLICHSLPVHSLLKVFTGLANAALIAWKLTVTPAITSAISPETANTIHPNGIL